jgi:acetolactate synthase-1/2/3 large subunit
MSDATTAVRSRETRNAGDTLVELAEHHGTERAFGIVSIHNQPLVDALVVAGRYVAVRHEATCVSAADAYARVTGRLGIAVTSTGTGAGNAAGALVEALTAGSPLLHVTGQIDSPFRGQGRGVIHETKDQLGMLAAVSKDASTIGSAAQVVTTLAEAAALALSAPRGPVSVEIPIDIQYDGTAAGFVPARQRHRSPPDPTAVDAAVKLITASKRPLVWLGGGATGAGEEVAALVDKLAAGVLTSNAGRGILREDRPNVVGNFASHPDAADLIDGADLLVSIGTHFRSNETRHYQLALPRPHVQIDVDPAAIGRAYPVDLSIVGDARLVVTALLEALGDVDTDPTWMGAIGEARERARDALRRAIGPYAVLCEAMRGAFDETSPLVRDITIPATSWGNRLLPIFEATTNIYARGGGIGQGLGMAIGAAVARPEVPTALMVGDGGLAVHLGELGTVADEQPWLVMIVFNDGGYGVLRNLQDRHFGRRAGVDLATPNFESLAGAYSLDYRRIESPDQAVAVLDKAVATRAPVVVEVDCDLFGPMPEPFVPPVPMR